MPNYSVGRNGWIGLHQLSGYCRKNIILCISKPAVVGAFQLYTDGEIIAAFSTLEAGLTSMPGLAIERHVLRYTAVSLDQQMSGYLQVRDFSKERMQGRVQTIAEQIIDVTTTEFSWRQADIVNDQQTDVVDWLPTALIWRSHLTDWMQEMIRYDELFRQMRFQP